MLSNLFGVITSLNADIPLSLWKFAQTIFKAAANLGFRAGSTSEAELKLKILSLNSLQWENPIVCPPDNATISWILNPLAAKNAIS